MKTWVIIVIVIVVLGVGITIGTQMPAITNSTSIENIRQTITNDLEGSFSIMDSNWNIWSKTFRDSGGILTSASNWDEFKSLFNNSPPAIVVQLDESSHIVWFKVAMNQVVYFHY